MRKTHPRLTLRAYLYEVPSMANILWTVIVILFVLWLIGLVGHIGGSLINILIVIVIIGVIYNLATGRKSV
jgi:Family of unknown function (DUF5670)